MNSPHGHIDQSLLERKDDYLYRISLKALIVNDNGEVLVVKESGRTWWDLPGGGMDHGETLHEALARELFEEISLKGDFTFHAISADEPKILPRPNVWQMRMVFAVFPTVMDFSAGQDSDEIAFVDPLELKTSDNELERRVYTYFVASNIAQSK